MRREYIPAHTCTYHLRMLARRDPESLAPIAEIIEQINRDDLAGAEPRPEPYVGLRKMRIGSQGDQGDQPAEGAERRRPSDGGEGA